MQYRRLGRTDLQVSLLGLGSGGRSRLGQAHGLEQDDVTRIVRRALDIGVNFIDTAPSYGRSEELLGAALQGVPRDSYVLGTKFRPWGEDAPKSADELRASLEQSLRALQADYVDILYLHGVKPEWLDPLAEQLVPAMRRAREDGLIRFLGITETFETDHAHATMQAAFPRGIFDVSMVGYNVLSPAPARHVLPLAQEHDVGIVIMCAVRGVLLKPERIREVVGEWKAEGVLAKDAVPDDEPLGWLLGPWANSIPAAAYKFAAAHPAVGTVLTGTGRLEHFEANAEAILGTPLPDEAVERAVDLFAPVSRNASF